MEEKPSFIARFNFKGHYHYAHFWSQESFQKKYDEAQKIGFLVDDAGTLLESVKGISFVLFEKNE